MNWDELKYFTEKLLGQPPFEGDFLTVGKHGFPQPARTNFLPEEPVLPINYLKSTKGRENYWFHCFTDDDKFHLMYNLFEHYVELLKQVKGFISADFSLFRDYPEGALIENCRANRLVNYNQHTRKRP